MLSDQLMAAAMAGATAFVPAMGTPTLPHDGATPRDVAIARNWAHQGLNQQVRGVDISLWNHPGNRRLDFNAMRGQGVRFVYIKASDTIARADRQAQHWWSIDKPAAKNARMFVGGYQYVYPTSKPSKIVPDARRNARRAAARVGVLGAGDLPLVLDLETAPRKLNRQRLTRWATEWLRVAKARTGKTPILYTYSYFAMRRLLPTPELTQYPLWQAEYGVGIQRPHTIPGWPTETPAIWQFSGNGRIAGAAGSLMDLNVWDGKPSELLKMAGYDATWSDYFGIPADPVEPTPTPDPVPTPDPLPSSP